MRLLNAKTFELKEFVDHQHCPEYAILSHTWGTEEVVFRDIDQKTDFRKKEGFRKIDGCAARALQNGYEWIWVDTCCIDKSSSAELSEAINSMYIWYERAKVCYAYLSDFNEDYGRPDFEDIKVFPSGLSYAEIRSPEAQFSCSRWFSRGCTL